MTEVRCDRCHGVAICVGRGFHAGGPALRVGGPAPSKQYGIKALKIGTYVRFFECTSEQCGHLWDITTRNTDVLGVAV